MKKLLLIITILSVSFVSADEIIFEITGWENDSGEEYIYPFMDWSKGVVEPMLVVFISLILALDLVEDIIK